jgi:hypothetical protein
VLGPQVVCLDGVFEARPIVRELEERTELARLASRRCNCAMASAGVPITVAPESIMSSIGSLPVVDFGATGFNRLKYSSH